MQRGVGNLMYCINTMKEEKVLYKEKKGTNKQTDLTVKTNTTQEIKNGTLWWQWHKFTFSRFDLLLTIVDDTN